MWRSKQPPVVTKFYGDVPFELYFERNWDLQLARSCGGSYWTPFINARARMSHQAVSKTRELVVAVFFYRLQIANNKKLIN